MAVGDLLFAYDPSKDTPETVARKRAAIAQLLASNRSPKNVGEGIGAMMSGIAAGVMSNRANRAETAGRENATSAIAKLLGGGMGGGSSISAAPPQPQETPQGQYANDRVAQAFGDPGAPQVAGSNPYRDAIASIESAGSGDYSAVGPTHPELGRALGRYQIMEANIGPWSQQVLGREVTPDEFMANPQIQDAIFDGIFNGYVEEYGPEGAAQAWFAGPGGVGKLDRKDSLGTDVGSYGQRFMQALGQNEQAAQPVQLAQAQPQTMNDAGPSMQQLLEVSQNPWLTDTQRGIVNVLLERQMQQNDPMRQMEMERAQLELEQLRNPQEDLINAGKGRLYNPNTGEWIVAPGVAAPNEAPTVKSFYDDQGREYKAQWNPATQQWDQVGGAKASSNGISVTSPDGTTIQVGGKLTEAQSKDVVYYTRGMDADSQLATLDTELVDFGQQAAGALPLGIGNYLRNPEFRQAKVAADQFLTAVLRKDTGAAITAQEFQIYGPMFLPVPGDDPATIEQKRRARQVALLAIRSGLGTAEAIGEANRLALGLPEQEIPASPASAGQQGVPEGVDPELWEVMTPEERALWN